MIAAGVAVRLIVAFATGGLPYDVHSFELVWNALQRAPLHVYSTVNPGVSFHWPYPPAFFPAIAALGALANAVGGFSHVIRIPAILADAGLAWLVWDGLAGRTDERRRLFAAGLVALGPVFITISAYAAQIDSLAILPAVMAVLVWERMQTPRRAWLAGALIGIGAAVKTVPLLMIVALAPTARSRRELVTLVGCAVAVPLATFLPFLAADASGVAGLRHYHGAPGLGGLSLVLQPGLAQRWLTHVVAPTRLTTWLFISHPGLLNAAVIFLVAGWSALRRPDPRTAAVVLWLAVLAFGSGFFFQYLVWVLPFLLLARQLWATAVAQALVAVPMVIFYLGPWRTTVVVYVTVAIMIVVWAAAVIGGALLALRASAA